MQNAQTEFFALDLSVDGGSDPSAELRLAKHDLSAALEDGTLDPLGSVYSPENNAVYDGASLTFDVKSYAPPQSFPIVDLPGFYYRSGNVMAMALGVDALLAGVHEGRFLISLTPATTDLLRDFAERLEP